MKNQTTQRVLELESKFESLFDCEVVLTIKAPLKEMQETASYLQCHMFTPYETGEEDNFHFFVFISERNKDMQIIVKSRELYKRKIDIIEM